MKNYFLPVVFLFLMHNGFAMEHENYTDITEADGFSLKNDEQPGMPSTEKTAMFDFGEREDGTSRATYVWTKSDSASKQSRNTAAVHESTQAMRFLRALFNGGTPSRAQLFKNLEPGTRLEVDGATYQQTDRSTIINDSRTNIIGYRREYLSTPRIKTEGVEDLWFLRVHTPYEYTTQATVHYYKKEPQEITLDIKVERSYIQQMPEKNRIEPMVLRTVGTLVAATGAAALLWKYIQK